MTTPLGSWVAIADDAGSDISGAFTPEAGTDRVAVLIASLKTDSGYTVGTKPVFTLSGGHTVAPEDTYVDTTSTTNAARRLAMAIVREADIPAGAETLTVTQANSSGVDSAAYRFFEGVLQAGPVREAASLQVASSADQTLTLATLENGDHIVAAGVNDDPGAVTLAGYVSLMNFGTDRSDVFEKAVTTTASEDLVFSFTGGFRSGSVALALISTSTPIEAEGEDLLTTTISANPTPQALVFGLADAPDIENLWEGWVLEVRRAAKAENAVGFRVKSHTAAGVFTVVPLGNVTFTPAAGDTVISKLSIPEQSAIRNRIVGEAVGTPTTTVVQLSGGVAVDGQFVGKEIEFSAGPAANLPRVITASSASANTVTIGALPVAPGTNEYSIV